MNERIRLLRKELGLNQSDFGNKILLPVTNLVQEHLSMLLFLLFAGNLM